jgi:hypothetical protein
MEMEARKRGHRRQALQAQVIGKMPLDVIEDPVHPVRQGAGQVVGRDL